MGYPDLHSTFLDENPYRQGDFDAWDLPHRFMVYGWWNDPSCQSLEDLHKPSGQEKWTMNRRNSCHGGVFEKDPCYVQK